MNLLLFGTRIPAFAGAILLLSGLSQMLFSQSQAAVKRSEIRVYTLADKTVKTVYAADKLIEAPNWSPDGTYLLVNTGGDLWKLPVKGAGHPELQKIDLGDMNKCNNDHGISPDGKLIVFSSSAKAHGSQIYKVPSSGGTPQLLVPETPSYFHGFSPDGKWFAIVSKRNDNFDLFRMPVAGGAQERLTSQARIRRRPRLFAGRQVDLLQFRSIGKLGHLEDARRWRRPQRRESAASHERRWGGLVSALLAGWTVARVSDVSKGNVGT